MFIISEQEEKCSVASFPSKPWTLQGDARQRQREGPTATRPFPGRLWDPGHR